jgi:hypothetical protein
MLASTLVTAAWVLATKSSIVLGGTVYTCSLRCPHRKESIGVRPGYRGGHAMGMSRSTTAGSLVRVAREFRRAETTTSVCSPGRITCRKLRYCWAVSLSGNRQGPKTMSPTIPESKRWRLSRKISTFAYGMGIILCPKMTVVAVEHTITPVKNASSVRGTLHKKSSSSVCVCNRLQICIRRGRSSGNRRAPRE